MTWVYFYTGVECYNDRLNMVFGAVMYTSYLALFVHFAVNKHFAGRKPTRNISPPALRVAPTESVAPAKSEDVADTPTRKSLRLRVRKK